MGELGWRTLLALHIVNAGAPLLHVSSYDDVVDTLTRHVGLAAGWQVQARVGFLMALLKLKDLVLTTFARYYSDWIVLAHFLCVGNACNIF